MVKMGSAGAEVRAIQHALGLHIDGSFGFIGRIIKQPKIGVK